MKEVRLYENVKALNKSRHADWTTKPTTGYEFAGNTNSCFLMTVEFAKASREYPIVFVKQDDKVFSVAVMGFRNDENLFVMENGEWDAGYVPAYIRRYPFIPSVEDSGEVTVCIDEGFSGFSQDGIGEPLFSDEGEPGEFLKKSMDFLRDFQGQSRMTMDFCKEIEGLGLLEPMGVKVDLNNGDTFALKDFMVVNRKRLTELKGEKIQSLLKSGGLEVIYSHLSSMTNFERLMAKIEQVAA